MKSSTFLKFLRVEVGMFYHYHQHSHCTAHTPRLESCRTYMINSNQGAVRPADLSTGILQTLEGLGRRHLVDEMSI